MVVAVAVMAAACGSGPEDAEVLGVVLERTPSAAPAADASPPSSDVDESAPRLPEPQTRVYASADGAEARPAQQDAEPQAQPETAREPASRASPKVA